jgi:hypothetical protein
LLREHRFVLSRELPGGWYAHIDQVALSKRGAPVSKHPVVMPILSLPFVAAFGKPGTEIFNLVQCAVLVAVMYLLALEVASPFAASMAVILTYVASFLPHYVWNYSPDLCATALLCGGTLLVATGARLRSWVWGGLLVGAACAAKYPFVLFLPGTFLLLRRPFWRPGLAVAAGMAIPLALLATFNIVQFGSPLVTGYGRIATMKPGYVPSTYSQQSDFNLPFQEGFTGQLFDRDHGLLPTSPVTLVALIGFPLVIWWRPRLGVHALTGSLALFLLYCKYQQWSASHYGNRFLMPVVAFAVIPLAALVQLAPPFRSARD